MKKYFTYLILLGIGFVLGYFLFYIKDSQPLIDNDSDPIIVERVKDKVVYDTVFVHKKEKQSENDSDSADFENSVADSLYSDSLQMDEFNFDNDNLSDEIDLSDDDDGEEIIIREELISQQTIILEPLAVDSTDVSELLSLKSHAFSEEIVVEFWQSPLNITGYELTRNKLKLFGFNNNERITLKLSSDGERLLLNTESMSIVLEKNKKFQTLNLR